MTPEDKISIDSFLDKLQSTARGRAMAVNMYETYAENLVPLDTLSAFLLDCARTHEALPSTDAVKIVQDVSCGQGHGKQCYLRLCKKEPFSSVGTERLRHTMKTVTFHTYLLDEKYKACNEGLPVVLPKAPISSSPSALRDYRERLAEVTADPTWKKSEANLGTPHPNSSLDNQLPNSTICWFTSDRFGKDVGAPKYPGDPATEARDELGLIDNGDGNFLLRLSFLASSTAKIPNNELARPIFSDVGNSRFRVRHSSSRAAEFAKHGWGATTHLGKFGDSEFSDSTGVCERVSSALPIADLEFLTVEFLGRVTKDRGMEMHDDDEAYAKELHAGRSEATIKNILLSILS